MIRHTAEIIIYSSDMGGRPSLPEGSGYSPHACSPDGEEYLPIIFHDIPTSATLNAKFEALIEFRYPDELDYTPLTTGKQFDLVEGVKRIGHAQLLD